MKVVFIHSRHAGATRKAMVSDQAAKVVDIIGRDSSITRLTAMHYGIANVTARIAELRNAGIQVLCENKVDAAGKRYGRWTLPSGDEVGTFAVI